MAVELLSEFELPHTSGHFHEADQVERLKNRVFDYWGRSLEGVLARLRVDPGRMALVWGGEVPENPLRLATQLILSGYDKVLFLDQFSHILGRDTIFASEIIADRPSTSVYKKRYLLAALNEFHELLLELGPLLECGLVELLPPAVFWSGSAPAIVRAKAEEDIRSGVAARAYSSPLEYGHGANAKSLDYVGVNTRLRQYIEVSRKSSYAKLAYMSSGEPGFIAFRGAAEEVNEAILAQSLLTTDNAPALVTDLSRHWAWLAAKLNTELRPGDSSFKYNEYGLELLDNMSASTLALVVREGVLHEVRRLIQTFVFSPASQLSIRPDELQEQWRAGARRVEKELKVLRSVFIKRFATRATLIPISVVAGAATDWLAAVSAAGGGWSLRDLASTRQEYRDERRELLARHPEYFLVRKSASTSKAVYWLSIDSSP